jgi:histidinol-phosphate aminotransferase
VDELIQGRRYLETALKEIKCVENVYPSDANYILIKVADANKMYQHLIQHKLIVRNRDNAPMLKGCLRVSVGTKQENEQFIDALKRYN